jgi:N utilization substance protein B
MKSNRSPRRRAREYAMQGLYQWLLADGDPGEILRQLESTEGFDRADRDMVERLWAGTVAARKDLDLMLARHLDREPAALSPVEHAILLIGAYELLSMPETPYRVVINEAIELAKGFGGTDGHKYVNGVLDKLAAELRKPETDAARKPRAAEAG